MALKSAAVFSWGDSRSNPSGFVFNRVKNLNTAPRNWVCVGGFSGHETISSAENENAGKSTTETDVSRKLSRDLSSLPSESSFICLPVSLVCYFMYSCKFCISVLLLAYSCKK